MTWSPVCSCAHTLNHPAYGCCSGQVAWQEEFWPTTTAEYVLHLLWTLSKRALWLLDPESRQSYVAAVPKVSKPSINADTALLSCRHGALCSLVAYNGACTKADCQIIHGLLYQWMSDSTCPFVNLLINSTTISTVASPPPHRGI